MAVLQGCVRTTPSTQAEDLACERGFRSAFSDLPPVQVQLMVDDLFVLPFPVVQAFRFDYAVTFVERAKTWVERTPDAMNVTADDPRSPFVIIGNPLIRLASDPEDGGTWDDPATWERMFTRERAAVLGLWRKLEGGH